MAGIYIHIPFCKQACNYCDFHFSTSMKNRGEMVLTLQKEIIMRKDEALNEIIETIYFGGGTPSVLSDLEIENLIKTVYDNFIVDDNVEITLEANPDDLSTERIAMLARTKINRLSIGVQSFDDSDLKMMNRAHTSGEALKTLAIARHYFDNISIDLIYGIPGMSNERWLQNIETALSFNIPHISSYALTVEPKTALAKMIASGEVKNPDDEVAAGHYDMLVEVLEKNNFVHYELSNFGKDDYFSRNNTAYWLGKKYIGIGPSAHSYNGNSRSWNVANNNIYIKSINENNLPSKKEVLTEVDRYNETIMTGLRTIWGIDMDNIINTFGNKYSNHLNMGIKRFIDDGLLTIENNILKTTNKGKFLADGIASDLFLVNL